MTIYFAIASALWLHDSIHLAIVMLQVSACSAVAYTLLRRWQLCPFWLCSPQSMLPAH